MAPSNEAVEAQQDVDNEMSEEAIARRAYEISQREDAGTSEENWQRAERELRDEQAQPDA